MNRREYRRKFRVLDQMLSAHSDLRDLYRRRSRALTLLVMAASIAATTLALSTGFDDVTILGIDAAGTTWLAGLSAFTFLLAIAELVVQWRERAWAHEHAARRLGELKGEFRRAEVSGDTAAAEGIDLDREYDDTMNAIVEIPNRHFNRLKARHRRKIAISQMLDSQPGVPIAYLRLRLLRRDLAKTSADDKAGEPLEEEPPGSPPSHEGDSAAS